MQTARILQSIARGPTGHLEPVERRERREAIRSLRQESDGAAERAPTLLVYDRPAPKRLVAHVLTRWSRAIARLLATSLDRQLAEGLSPESHPMLAARSRVLVTPAERQKLAYLWADLIARARGPQGVRSSRASINRTDILACERGIVALLELLVAPTTGNVRGIALLSSLLSDASGPLYDRRSKLKLGAALLEAHALLRSSEF